jgi:hypothetical protein
LCVLLRVFAAFISSAYHYCRLHWLAQKTRYEPRRLWRCRFVSSNDGDSRTQTVRGAAEEEREKSSSSGCRLGCCCAFLIFRQREKSRISRIPGSLYLAALDSQRWPKRITRLMLSTACICKYFVSGQWAVPTGDLVHELTGSHLQGEPNCQPTEGSQPDGFCAGRQLATLTASLLAACQGL